MNYQYIYRGMVKRASAQQVAQLAGMIKIARMQKAGGLRDFVGRLFTRNMPKPTLLPPASYSFKKQLAEKAAKQAAKRSKRSPITYMDPQTGQIFNRTSRGTRGAKGTGASTGSAGANTSKPSSKYIFDMTNDQLNNAMPVEAVGASTNTPINTPQGFFQKHPGYVTAMKWGVPTMVGGGLFGGGLALGSAGNSDLRGALQRSNKQLQKTTNELNAAKKGSGSFWQDLLNALALAWKRWFPDEKKTTSQPSSNTDSSK